MIPQKIELISSEDIESLIRNIVSESKTIEYKRDLPDDTGDSKKEFLADVSSFANADGGDLIYGVTAKDGIPKEIFGISIESKDKCLLRLETLIRDGIAPRIKTEMRFIEFDNKNVLVIRVRKSWNKPHRIELSKNHRFFSRNSAGKYLLDIDELRHLFLGSDTFNEKIREFISSRNSVLLYDEGVLPLGDIAKLALFIIPIDAYASSNQYDIYNSGIQLWPPYADGCSPRINLDGLLSYFQGHDKTKYSYAQLYRNGAIEAVTSGLFISMMGKDRKIIPSTAVENVILESLDKYLQILRKIEVPPPYIFGFSLIGIKDYTLGCRSSRDFFMQSAEYGKDILRIPEISISEFETPLDVQLKGSFDMMWNAFGYKESENYNAEGRRVHR